MKKSNELQKLKQDLIELDQEFSDATGIKMGFSVFVMKCYEEKNLIEDETIASFMEKSDKLIHSYANKLNMEYDEISSLI